MPDNPSQNPTIGAFGKLSLMLRPHRKDLYSIYVLAFFNGLIMLSIPLGIQTITNFLMTNQVTTSWIVMIVFVLVGVAIAYHVQVYQIRIVESLRQKIYLHSVFEVGTLMPKWKMESIDGKYAPEVVNRFFDILTIQGKLAKVLIDFSIASTQVVFGLILLAIYDSQFILVSLVSVLYFFILFRSTFKKGLKTSKEESEYKYETVAWVEEGARSLETMKLAQENTMFMEKIDKISGNYLQARLNHFGILMKQYRGLIWYKVLVTAMLLVLGGLLVIEQRINIGQFVAAEITILTIIASLEKIMLSVEHIYDTLIAVEKVSEITSIETEEQGEKEVETEQGFAIELKDVSYKFENNADYTLQQINLSIKPGEKVCITGEQGSGKSLFLYLLATFYQDYTGTIRFNGIDLQHMKLDSVRDMIAENISKTEVFRHTLRQNITLSKPMSDAALMQIIDQVALTDFVRSLPKGLDTELMTEDKRLTKGIRMKIKLARCLAKEPRLILFEDGMGRIDKATRDEIRDRFLSKNTPWTLVAVTNNPMHFEKYDRVIFMKNGQIESIKTNIK